MVKEEINIKWEAINRKLFFHTFSVKPKRIKNLQETKRCDS